MKLSIIVISGVMLLLFVAGYFYAYNYIFTKSVNSYVVDFDNECVYEAYRYSVYTPNILTHYIYKVYRPIIAGRKFSRIQAHTLYVMIRSSFPDYKYYGIHSAELYYTRYTDTSTAIGYMAENFNQLDWSNYARNQSFCHKFTKTFIVKDMK